MRSLPTILFLALAAPLLAADLAALGDRLSDPDPSVRADAVKEIREVDGAAASKLLAKALGDRDADVRLAAVKALGGRRDDVAVKALRNAFRRFEDDADLRPLVILSLGDSGVAEMAGKLADLLPKSLGVDPRTTRSVIEALGRMRSKEAMEGLMLVLGKAWDTRPQGPEHPQYLSEVLRALTEQTELHFSDTGNWERWWRHAKKNYRGASPDVADVDTEYRHDGWRFSIERPEGDRWEFSRPSGAVVRIAWRGPKEEAGFAWIDVIVESAVDPEETTRDARASEVKAWMEETLRDVRDAKWGEPARCGRASGIRHSATGLLKQGAVVRWRAFICERNDILYTVSTHVESGAADSVLEEVEAILDSFRLLDS